MLAILLLVVVVPCAYSLGVIAPLYFDPSGDCSSWSSIFSAVSDHSATSFYLVINPNNGPGTAGSQPDPSYDACVPRLRPSSNPNAIVLGYVDVSSKSFSSVLADIDTYAGWSSSSRPTGIFFDSTTASSVGKYQSFVTHAKDKGFSFIAMDPGEPPNSDYYSLADLVNTYENYYSSFQTADLVTSSSAPASKQSVILSMAPSSSSYSAVLSQLASLGVAAVYITDHSSGASRISEQWSAFVSDVAAAGGASPNSAIVSSPSLSPQTAPTNNAMNTPLSGSGTITSQLPSGTSTTSKTLVRSPSTSPFPVSSSPWASPSPSPSSPSFTQTSSPSPTSGAASKSSFLVGAIVGGVLGVIILVLLGMFFILRRRRKQSFQTDEAPLIPFLSRQPFTLLQTAEKRLSPTDTHTAPETEAGTSLPMPAETQPSASNYGGGGGGVSEKRRPSIIAASNRATIASAQRRISAGGTLHRYSFDPPPSYHAPSLAPV